MAFFQLVHPDDMDFVLKKWDEFANDGILNFSNEHRFIHKSGLEVFVNASVTVVQDELGKPQYYIAAYEDITQRKAAELQIKDALKEKEILIKEIHHRVKNNMQVISSILNLQCLYIQDERTIEMLKESQNRIKSMSYIHEALYQSNNLEKINFSEYVKSLSSNLNQSLNLNRETVKLVFDLDEVYLVLDTAIPLGLIINELITNAFKYAFSLGQIGELRIELKTTSNLGYVLTVSDTGKGLPAEIDIHNTETLGLQLVSTLVQQIGGQIVVDNQKGTIFVVKFNENIIQKLN
jgi:two-component sensor histidine kinase